MDYTAFMMETLVPAARAILLAAFEAHKRGEDIGIDRKNDDTPASRADRDTEQALRALIAGAYPDHGIVGEEFGADRADAEFVWVLDPLDGTKEFLALESGWGGLVALLHKGRPIAGIIDDTLNGVSWSGIDEPKTIIAKPIGQAVAASTNPGMFDQSLWARGAAGMFAAFGGIRPRLNCLGFASVADGTTDLAAECFLKLHDIAALLPVLWAAGARCVMPDGQDYKDFVFDPAEDRTYDLITARDPVLLRQALDILQGKTI